MTTSMVHWTAVMLTVTVLLIAYEARKARRAFRASAVRARCLDAEHLRGLGYMTLTDAQIRATPGAPILIDCAWNEQLNELLGDSAFSDRLDGLLADQVQE